MVASRAGSSPEASGLRMQIYEYIRAHPAAHILEIAQAFDITHPTVMYHLDLLADEGYVLSSIWGKRRVHFDTGAHFNAWEREILAILAVEEARAIVDLIAARPGTFPREIAQQLGVSDTTVKRYVPEALRLGIITEIEGGFRRRVAISRTFVKRATALLAKVPDGSAAARRLEALAPGTPAARVAGSADVESPVRR